MLEWMMETCLTKTSSLSSEESLIASILYVQIQMISINGKKISSNHRDNEMHLKIRRLTYLSLIERGQPGVPTLIKNWCWSLDLSVWIIDCSWQHWQYSVSFSREYSTYGQVTSFSQRTLEEDTTTYVPYPKKKDWQSTHTYAFAVGYQSRRMLNSGGCQDKRGCTIGTKYYWREDQVSISNAVLIISFLGETRALLFFFFYVPLLPIGLVLLSDWWKWKQSSALP